MRKRLVEPAFPVDEIRYFSSKRSADRALDWRGAEIVVEDAATADGSGFDLALMNAGKASALEYSPAIAAAGAVVIDNSLAWRMDPDVPLVVPEANAIQIAEELLRRGRLPN